MRRARLLTGLALVVTACVVTATQGDVRQASHGVRSPELARIVADYWSHLSRESPMLRARNGQPVDRLPDVSFEGAVKDAAFAKSLLARLKHVDPATLSHEDWVTRAILEWELQHVIEESEFFYFRFQLTPYSSALRGVAQLFPLLPVRTSADRERYLALLKRLPTSVCNLTAVLEEQQRRGIVMPREELEIVLPVVRALARPPQQSAFHVADAQLATVDASVRGAFEAASLAAIPAINASLEELAAHIDGPYRKTAPPDVGLKQYPGGPRYYRYLVRRHTTLDLTPEQVHDIGLAEVDRINREMEHVRKKVGFTGTKAEFHTFLRTDPRFFPRTPDDIGERLMSHMAAMERLLPQYFRRRPTAPYGVKRLDPSLEAAMTYGYYDRPSPGEPAGHYLYNASNLPQRSLLNAAALIYHELAPGHHFQIALQAENDALPHFRREGGHTAFIEGWGEYASALAGEMGLYTDPYDQYGRLMMDMFLSVRLVVDTGMNYLEWPRAKAAAYMKEHTLESDVQIYTETLRYSADMPGQALAYKIGSRKLRELRDRANAALGPAFDIRAFHEVVIGSGSMPLSVLEQHLDWFVREQQRAATKDAAAQGRQGVPPTRRAAVRAAAPLG